MVFALSIRVKNFPVSRVSCLGYHILGFRIRMKCGGCNVSYYSRTKRHSKIRIGEQLVFLFAGKKAVT